MLDNLTPNDLMLAAMLIPAAAVLFIMTGSERTRNIREGFTLIAALAVMATVYLLGGAVMGGAKPYLAVHQIVPGLEIAFSVEPLGMLFALIAGTLWLVNSVYSIGYMRWNNEPRQTVFYMCFAVAIASAMGIAFADNLFTLFLFYEVLTFSTYPLVTHKQNEDARKSGRMYLGILVGTSVTFLLPALFVTYSLAGTLDFDAAGLLWEQRDNAWALGALSFLFIYGIGKAAVMPVHRWLPAAMVAPTPVSALLHAVAVVKAGVFSVVKVIVYVFGIETFRLNAGTDWVVYAAGFTVLVGSIIALGQDNLKRRLAYSTISQLSYVVLAAAMATPVAIMGAALHIAAHAFGKITLFFAAGSIYTAAHKTEISQLDGIGKRMPITMLAFTVGALSMIGLPPTAGFISKWYIMTAAMQTEDLFVLLVLFGSTMLNAAYFIPISYRAFFKEETVKPHHEHGEAPLPIVLALSVTALITLYLFFNADIPLTLARMLVPGAGG